MASFFLILVCTAITVLWVYGFCRFASWYIDRPSPQERARQKEKEIVRQILSIDKQIDYLYRNRAKTDKDSDIIRRLKIEVNRLRGEL